MEWVIREGVALRAGVMYVGRAYAGVTGDPLTTMGLVSDTISSRVSRKPLSDGC